MQQQKPVYHMKVQYRNGNYEGGIRNSKREGFGLIITDKSQILMAEWEMNKVNGMYAYITQKEQAYGEMEKSKLVNVNVIITDQLTIYGYFRDGLLHGNALFKYPTKYELWRFQKGVKKQLLDQNQPSKDKINNILRRQFKDPAVNIRSFISNKINNNEFLKRSTFRQILINTQYRYYGFSDKKGQGNGLGMVFKSDLLFNCGWYEQTELNGIGRMYNNQEIHDGVFVEGFLRGIGVKYNKINNKYTYGIHSQDGSTEKGIGFPQKQILQTRRQFHLRSVNFQNQAVVAGLLIKCNLNQIMYSEAENQGYVSRFSRNSKSPTISAKMKQQKILREQSPLRARLKTYERQSEYLADKQQTQAKFEPMQLYQPVNRFRNNTTRIPINQQIENEASRTKYNEVQKSHKSYLEQNKQVKSRIQYEQKSAYQRYNEHKGSRNKKNQEQNLIYKDTMEMIRQLEQQQKRKRNDLAKVKKQQQQVRNRNKRLTYS